MIRSALFSLLLLTLHFSSAQAQSWGQKMFTEGVVHDFGNVPRGAQLVHKFKITNIYAVRMEVLKVQSGCGCVSASVVKRSLEPRESTVLEVSMDARRFTGPKTVTVRVSFGPEYISTAEVRVTATCRSDVVFNPGELSFGTVTRGQTPSQNIDIEYAGVLEWQIKEIVIPKGFPFVVTSKELYRKPGQVGYQIQLTVKADAPVGAIKQEMFLKTNDSASPVVPVLVEAAVLSALTVSPEALALGPVSANQPLIRRVVVRGARPFRILGVEGAGEQVTLGSEPSTNASTVQTLTLKCQPTEAGDFRYVVTIKTDIPEGEGTLTITGTAQ